MDFTEIKEASKKLDGFKCRVCNECNGIACRGEIPGLGGKDTGRSFIRNFEDWQSAKIKMSVLYENKDIDTRFEFLGNTYKMPVFIAPMGALTMNFGPVFDDRDYAEAVIEGAKRAGTLAFTGDGLDIKCFNDPVDIMQKKGLKGVPTCKPWDEAGIMERINYALDKGINTIAMDVDAAGLPFIIKAGEKAGPKSIAQLKSIIDKTGINFIVKGIMTPEDARKCVEAGAKAIVVSNHGGRVLDLCPSTYEVLPSIVREVEGEIKILVDGGIRSGVNVFTALAMGADAVLIGRPVGLAAYGGRELGDAAGGVESYLDMIYSQLIQTMKMTGCCSLKEIREKKPLI
jgi:4-hydroxymandelate oxidase